MSMDVGSMDVVIIRSSETDAGWFGCPASMHCILIFDIRYQLFIYDMMLDAAAAAAAASLSRDDVDFFAGS